MTEPTNPTPAPDPLPPPHGLLQNPAFVPAVLVLAAIGLLVYCHFSGKSISDAVTVITAALTAAYTLYCLIKSLVEKGTTKTKLFIARK